MSDSGRSSEISLGRVLDLLDKWRHLPKYQLERRADVLFALFLPEVLENRFCINKLHLIPEFPIKKSLLPEPRRNSTYQSINVDFLVVEEAKDSGAARRAFLVELKTDKASKRDSQLCDLRSAAEKGMKELIKGVIEICGSNTKQRKKYVHLLKMLSCLDLVRYEDTLFCRKPGFRKILECIKDDLREKNWPSLEVLYVAPEVIEDVETIDFNKFAKAIEDRDDSEGIRHIFACYLREWAVTDAGDRDPKDWISP